MLCLLVNQEISLNKSVAKNFVHNKVGIGIPLRLLIQYSSLNMLMHLAFEKSLFPILLNVFLVVDFLFPKLGNNHFESDCASNDFLDLSNLQSEK